MEEIGQKTQRTCMTFRKGGIYRARSPVKSHCWEIVFVCVDAEGRYEFDAVAEIGKRDTEFPFDCKSSDGQESFVWTHVPEHYMVEEITLMDLGIYVSADRKWPAFLKLIKEGVGWACLQMK